MKHSKTPKIIIIIGPPGSGKGTQAELLAERLNICHLETSKIIEENFKNITSKDFVAIDGKKYFLTEERKKRYEGELMSPPLILFWIKNKIKELKKDDFSIVFSGSPRTIYEGERLIPFLKKVYGSAKAIKVILLEISPKQSIWRNSRRKTCELMRHSILFGKETAMLKKCPLDGSKLLVRKDDNAQIIKERLEEYRERTFPLINLFKKQGLKIKRINGEQSVADVFKDILKSLE